MLIKIRHFLQSGSGFLWYFFTGQLIYGQELIRCHQPHFELFEILKYLIADREKLIKGQPRLFLPAKRVFQIGLI